VCAGVAGVYGAIGDAKAGGGENPGTTFGGEPVNRLIGKIQKIGN
jgi:hypothetical protein